MLDTIKFIHFNLSLFDGEGGASGEGGNGVVGEGNNGLVATDTGDLSKVKYGVQTDSDDGVVEDGENTDSPKKTTEDRRKAFNDLISKEYKDIYTEETQKMINRRFKETKKLEKQLSNQSAVLDMVFAKHGITDGNLESLKSAIENDDSYWEDAADEANMSVEQYKKFDKLQKQNAELLKQQQQQREFEQVNSQLEKWNSEADELKKTFPNFDLETEAQNPDFQKMLLSGVPMDHAYKVIHFDEINSHLIQKTQKMTEKRVVDNIRSKGKRPSENGASSQSGFTTKTDVTKLTKEDRAEVARRALRGEIISF